MSAEFPGEIPIIKNLPGGQIRNGVALKIDQL